MTQLASDNFTRANGALGANWTQAAGGGSVAYTIVSNQAVEATLGSVSVMCYTGTAAPNDGYAEATIGSTVETGSDQGCGPCYRASTTFATCYFVQSNTHETRLYKVVTSAFTQLGIDGPPGTLGDIFRLTCNGTALTVTKNGSSIITATDAAITSGNAGIFGAPSGVTNSLSLFAFGDLTGGGGGGPLQPFRQTQWFNEERFVYS